MSNHLPTFLRPSLRRARVQSKVPEFLAQGEPGQPQPPRSLRLVAFRQRDRLCDHLTFGFPKHLRMRILHLARLRPSQ